MELIAIEGNFIKSLKEIYLGAGMDKSHWSRWFKKNVMENTFFAESQDYQTLAIEANGNKSVDITCTLDMAKHLIMQMPTEKAHEYRQYLIDYEKQHRTIFKVPTTFREALLLAADQQLIIEQQAETIEEQKLLLNSQAEKVEIYDALTNSEKCLSMKNARHLLGFITKNEFKNFLILAHCMNPISGTLKAEYIQKGYFKSFLVKNEFIPEYYVTQKGLLWLQKRKQKLDL